MTYVPAESRYDGMAYRRSGRSGLKLPAISLGLWQNFGHDRPLELSRSIVRRAFDLGITHFDLANNYGPPYGAAELTFGRLFGSDLAPYRDELDRHPLVERRETESADGATVVHLERGLM